MMIKMVQNLPCKFAMVSKWIRHDSIELFSVCQLHYNISIWKMEYKIYIFIWSECKYMSLVTCTVHAFFHVLWLNAAQSPGIILCMHQDSEKWCYNVTSSLIGWVHTQTDPWVSPMYMRVLHWNCDTLILSPMSAKTLCRTWLNKSHESTESYIEVEIGHHIPNNIFKCISLIIGNKWILIKIQMKSVPKIKIDNNTTLVQTMVWCPTGDKPLSEPTMA